MHNVKSGEWEKHDNDLRTLLPDSKPKESVGLSDDWVEKDGKQEHEGGWDYELDKRNIKKTDGNDRGCGEHDGNPGRDL